ncbi:MAG: hypothetical protein AB7S56_00355, partial [Halothiobacillaceae bacterium]
NMAKRFNPRPGFRPGDTGWYAGIGFVLTEVSIRARGLGRAIRHLRNLWFHKWVCAVSREPLRFGKHVAPHFIHKTIST